MGIVYNGANKIIKALVEAVNKGTGGGAEIDDNHISKETTYSSAKIEEVAELPQNIAYVENDEDVEIGEDPALHQSDVVDSLNTSIRTRPLSANQGAVLNSAVANLIQRLEGYSLKDMADGINVIYSESAGDTFSILGRTCRRASNLPCVWYLSIYNEKYYGWACLGESTEAVTLTAQASYSTSTIHEIEYQGKIYYVSTMDSAWERRQISTLVSNGTSYNMQNASAYNFTNDEREISQRVRDKVNFEITDLRVGYDGRTYDTAGEAVREQFNSIIRLIEEVRNQ